MEDVPKAFEETQSSSGRGRSCPEMLHLKWTPGEPARQFIFGSYELEEGEPAIDRGER